MASVSGTTKDSAGAFAAKLVRLHREDTGAFVNEIVSDAATGAWSIPTDDTEKHVATVHDSAGDYYWSKIGLYLPLNANLSDVSATPKTVTAVGSAAFNSSLSPFGGGSLLLNGTTDYLSIADHADLQAGTGACAFECMFYLAAYPTAGNYFYIASKYSSGTARWDMYLGNSTTTDSGLRLAFGNVIAGGHTNATVTLASLGITTGTWHYAGWQRFSDGTVIVILNNTILPVSTVNAADISLSGQPLTIGARNGASSQVNGRIAHARWTKGSGRLLRKKPLSGFPIGAFSPTENALVFDNLTPV